MILHLIRTHRDMLLDEAKQAFWLLFCFACLGGFLNLPAVARWIGGLT